MANPPPNKIEHKATDSEFVEDIPQEYQPIVKAYIERYQGPLPPAAEFEKYRAVLADAPDRILKMAEAEQQNTFALQKNYVAYKARGQHYALAIVVAAFLLNAFLAWLGYPGIGFIISGTALVSVVGAFIYSEYKQSEE